MKTKIFMKGLRTHYGAGAEEFELAAKNSIYVWWWRFLRLSPVLWYANKTGLEPVDPKTRKVFAEGGQLFHGYFQDWWAKNSERLFAEPYGRKELKAMKLDEARDHRFDRESIIVEVPLSIPIERIMTDFNKILRDIHPGRHMNLAAKSRAIWPLKSMRFRVDAVEKEYWSLLYKSLHPKLAAVRIGDRLQVAPHLKIRGTDWSENETRYKSLNSIAGRYIYKGKFTLLNAERGSFPNSASVKLPDDFMPFGKRHQEDFLNATSDDSIKPSAWRQWLIRNYEEDLKSYVYERNNRGSKNSSVDLTTRKFLDFYRGKSDLFT